MPTFRSSMMHLVAVLIDGDVGVYSGQQLIAKYDSGATAANPNIHFVYASYIDEPILLDKKTAANVPFQGALASGSYYYHRNRQYSISALTNSTGSVVERYSYTAYGKTTIHDSTATNTLSNSPTANPFAYTARYHHSELSLHYFRARWYDPELGRFISRDPLGFVDGMSLYRGYFAPLNFDPFGFTTWYACEATLFGGKETTKWLLKAVEKAMDSTFEKIGVGKDEWTKDKLWKWAKELIQSKEFAAQIKFFGFRSNPTCAIRGGKIFSECCSLDDSIVVSEVGERGGTIGGWGFSYKASGGKPSKIVHNCKACGKDGLGGKCKDDTANFFVFIDVTIKAGGASYDYKFYKFARINCKDCIEIEGSDFRDEKGLLDW